jgi:hypothetical protein
MNPSKIHGNPTAPCCISTLSVKLGNRGFGTASPYHQFFGGDRLCGTVIRVLGYRSGGPGSIPSTTRKKKVVGLERGSLSLVLDRKVAAPV